MTQHEYTGAGDFSLPRLARDWSEGLFVGNGEHGAMVWWEDGFLHIELGHAGISHRRSGRTIEDMARIPIGAMRSPFGSEGTMSLVLAEAEIRVSDQVSGRTVSVRAQADAPIICIHDTDPETDWAFHAWPSIVSTQRSENTPNPPPARHRVNEIDVHLQPFLGQGGFVVARMYRLDDSCAHHFISMQVDYESIEVAESQVLDAIQAAAGRDPEESRAAHQGWWESFLGRSSMDLPDEELKAFCLRQHYKLGAAVRPDGPAMDLFGPWYRDSRWTHYFWNLNVQGCLFPAAVSGHPELIKSLANMLVTHQENLRRNVPDADKADPQMQISGTTGNDCRGRTNDEMGNLLWACQLVWEWAAYTGNEEIIRSYLWPVLIPAVNHHLSRTRVDDKGVLHTGVASSPEYGDSKRALAEDCHYEMSLLRWACQVLLDTHSALGVAHEKKADWDRVVQTLAPYPSDETGFMVGRNVPFDRSHRHWSHLFACFPLYQLDPDKSQDRPLIEKSLKHWLSLDQHLAGYSHAAAASMWASLGEGDNALAEVKKLIHEELQPNTMYLERSHPFDRANPRPDGSDRLSPTLETPLMAWRSLMDMLICSRNDRVHLLPALPSSWKDVGFDGLLAHGGLRVSLSAKNGVLDRLELFAKNPWEGTLVCPCADFRQMVQADCAPVTEVSETRVSLSLGATEYFRLGQA